MSVSFKGARFPKDVILHAVFFYLRYDFAGHAVHLHRTGEELDRRRLVASLREH